MCLTLLFLSIYLFLSCSKFRFDYQGRRNVLFVLQCIPSASPPAPASARPFITKRCTQSWIGLFIIICKGRSTAGNENVSPIILSKGINIRPFAPAPITFLGDNLNQKTFSKSNHASTTTTPKPWGDLFINYVDCSSGYLMLITDSVTQD